MNRRKYFVIFGLVVALIIVIEFTYPIYPSGTSLCELIRDRARHESRWVSPHRGASFKVTGTLHNAPYGMYALFADCSGHPVMVAVELKRWTISNSETRETLRELQKSDWKKEDRSVSAQLYTRVDSEVQSCFGPGMVLTALSVKTEGAMSVKPTGDRTTR